MSELADVEKLIAALSHENYRVRARAAMELGEIRDARAIPPLCEAIHDDDFGVRYAAIEALGKLGDARAVPALIDLLNDDTTVATAMHLYRIGDIAQKSLKRIGREALPLLIEALDHKDEVICRRAAWILGELGDERAILPLATVIAAYREEPHTPAAISAMAALRRIGSPLALDALKTARQKPQKRAEKRLFTDLPMTLGTGDIVGRRAMYSPDVLAVVDASESPHRCYTYAQLNQRANKLAYWLRENADIAKGDRVAILASSTVEYLDLFFACAKLGAICTCLPSSASTGELGQMLDIIAPKALAFSAAYRDLTAQITAEPREYIHLLHVSGVGLFDSVSFETVFEQSPAAPVETPDLLDEQIACILFNPTGARGLPKATMVSHRMIAWNTLNTVLHDLRHGDTTVSITPLYEPNGLLLYTLPLLILGGTVVLGGRVDGVHILTLLEQYGASFFYATPTVYEMMTWALNWSAADLSRLRFCASNEAVTPETIKRFREDKGLIFQQGYGWSEFGPAVFTLEGDEPRETGSIGRPQFFVGARVVDERNQPLPPNTVGELVLRGQGMASGYFNSADFVARVDEQGWYHTGELARYDETGSYTLTDRKQEMFVSGGAQVSPAEVEATLYEHPAVHLAAVVGVPDDAQGAVGKAFVVLKPGEQASPEDLRAYLRGHLDAYKVPQTVEIKDALPVTREGRVLKGALH